MTMQEITINGKWTLALPAHRSSMDWDHWEKERLDSMHNHLDEGDVIFDVGAEEGDLPALWSSWGCEVVCFEPGVKYWPNIKAIWEANHLTPMKGYFVGFVSDVTDLSPKNLDKTEQGSTADGRWPSVANGHLWDQSDFRHLAQQSTESPQVTIDDFVDTTGIIPNALTIDVEGSEFRVLKGAKKTLKNNSVKVWVSIHIDRPWVDEFYRGFTADDVVSFMSGLGYDAEHLVTDHEEHWRFWK